MASHAITQSNLVEQIMRDDSSLINVHIIFQYLTTKRIIIDKDASPPIKMLGVRVISDACV